MTPIFTTAIDFAKTADSADELAGFKNQFHFPKKNGKDVIYFCGNSLGLQPIQVEDAIKTEIDSWKELAVGGYFGGKHPWLFYQDYLSGSLSKLIGSKETEVTVMNSLTVNLHLLMLSFYRPTNERFTILMEAGAFPSDQYAVETLVTHFGLHPNTTIIEIAPKAGEYTIQTEAIVEAIEASGNKLAMVLFGGINYYTGQYFNVQKITEAAHAVGAIAAFDLAHVVGNIPLELHNWGVDFAIWCSYKYLNGGPGAVGGIFVHEKYAKNIHTPRLGGWWGNDEKSRFKMEKGFVPKPNASGWNMSTAQVFNTVCLKASLEIFEQVGIGKIRAKSIQLTSYLAYLLSLLPTMPFEVITPMETDSRGAQLSLFFSKNGKEIYLKLKEAGVVVDYREPGVIRVAPAPLYCSFMDVFTFYTLLKETN